MHLFPFPCASRSRVALHPNWGVRGGRHHFRVGMLPQVTLPPLQDAGGAKEGEGGTTSGLPLPCSCRRCAQGRMGAPIPIPEWAPDLSFACKWGQVVVHPSCVCTWSPPPCLGCMPPWPCASQPSPLTQPPVST